jgi:hypothetical protein
MAQAASPTSPPTNINSVPIDPFILLLKGIYEPVTSGAPDLGVTGIGGQTIDLNDGSWSRTRIYPVFGIPSADNQDQNGHDQRQDKNHNNVNTMPIGCFYAQLSKFEAGLPLSQLGIAYELPGGAITQQFITDYAHWTFAWDCCRRRIRRSEWRPCIAVAINCNQADASKLLRTVRHRGPVYRSAAGNATGFGSFVAPHWTIRSRRVLTTRSIGVGGPNSRMISSATSLT